MMKSRRFILVLITLAALALNAADSLKAQTRPELTEEFHQTYPLAPGGRVSLSNISGAVRIVAWDRGEVRVDAVKRASTPERLREAQIVVSAAATRVRIETDYPEHRRGNTLTFNRDDDHASVDYTLNVPRGAAIDEVNTVSGPLTIEGVSGPVHASSVSGPVRASGLSGSVNLSVVGGRLEATLDRLNESGGVQLSAVSGVLAVTLPSDANAVVHANTVSGRIANDFNLPVRVGEYVGRDLEGRLGRGGTSVRVSTVSGTIQILRAKDGRTPSQVTNLLSETRRREDFDDDDDDARDDARDAERDAEREATRETREAEREKNRERREELREAERERREAVREREEEKRERQRELDDVARESERAARDAERSVTIIDKEKLREEVKSGLRGAMTYDSARRTERESNAFQVSGAPRVRVATFDGAVNVHAWDKSEVMYTAVKRATDEREMQGVRVTAQQAAGGEVTINADFDKKFAHSFREEGGRITVYSSRAEVEFDVYVPRNATLSVSSGDGRLRVDGVSGELELRTGDGSIDVTGARGKLRAETGDGRIRVEGFDGDAEARTGDGRITLDGNFRTLSARTGDGGISLTLPEGANATVETHAPSVYNDGVAVAETDAESHVRRWRVGSGGGQLLTLRTGDGQIILRRR